MIDAAVLLAAGRGSRMGGALAKALLPLVPGPAAGHRPPTFLSRHLALLAEVGVVTVVIVAHPGNADQLRAAAGRSASVIECDAGEHAGSAASLRTALDLLVGQRRGGQSVLVLDADTVYERRLLRTVRSECTRSTLFSIDRVGGDEEEVRVYGSAEAPVLLGKGLPTSLVPPWSLLGESLGLVYLAPEQAALAHDLLSWLLGAPAGTGFGALGNGLEHELVWQLMFALRQLSVTTLSAELTFAECDTPADYDHVLHETYPQIVDRDANTSELERTSRAT